jgi:hypothetical protein
MPYAVFAPRRPELRQLQVRRLTGMRVQLAAEQQKPLPHALAAVQSALQLLPLHDSRPAHEAVPRQAIRFVPAFTLTPPIHDIGPVQLISHRLPEHMVVAGQDPVPEQVTVFMPPSAVMPLRHELMPLQVTLHVEPPH